MPKAQMPLAEQLQDQLRELTEVRMIRLRVRNRSPRRCPALIDTRSLWMFAGSSPDAAGLERTDFREGCHHFAEGEVDSTLADGAGGSKSAARRADFAIHDLREDCMPD